MANQRFLRLAVQVAFLLTLFAFIHYAFVPYMLKITGLARHSRSLSPGLSTSYWSSLLGHPTIGDSLSNLPKDKILKILQPLHFSKPHVPVFQNKQWQVVNDPIYEVYLFSAHYDDRPLIGGRKTRVFAVAEEDVKDLLCLTWYRNRAKADLAFAEVTRLGPQYMRHEKMFASYMYSCDIQNNRWPPEYVSIITTESIVPSVLVKVNQPENLPLKQNFGICASIVYGDINPHRFVEWLELVKIWGVTKVHLYNNSANEKILKVFKFYHDSGSIDIMQAPNVMEDPGNETIFLSDGAIINDCLYRHMYKYRYIIVSQFDQIIVPHKHMDYEEMLEYINDDLNLTSAAPSYSFRNAYFFLDYSPAVEDPPYLVMTRFLTRVPPSGRDHSPMTMIDPLICLHLNRTRCENVVPKFANTKWNYDVNVSMSLAHHYKLCDFDQIYNKTGMCNDTLEKYVFDDTMVNFIDSLTQKAIEVLWRLELVDLFPMDEEGEEIKKDMESDADKLTPFTNKVPPENEMMVNNSPDSLTGTDGQESQDGHSNGRIPPEGDNKQLVGDTFQMKEKDYMPAVGLTRQIPTDASSSSRQTSINGDNIPGGDNSQIQSDGDTQSPGGDAGKISANSNKRHPGDVNTQIPAENEEQAPGVDRKQNQSEGDKKPSGGDIRQISVAGHDQPPGIDARIMKGEGNQNPPDSKSRQVSMVGQDQVVGTGTRQTQAEGDQKPMIKQIQTESINKSPGGNNRQTHAESDTKTPSGGQLKKSENYGNEGSQMTGLSPESSGDSTGSRSIARTTSSDKVDLSRENNKGKLTQENDMNTQDKIVDHYKIERDGRTKIKYHRNHIPDKKVNSNILGSRKINNATRHEQKNMNPMGKNDHGIIKERIKTARHA